MKEYLLQRLAQLVPVLFFLSLIVFTVVRLIPGDPAAMRLGDNATAEAIALIRQEMGLDQPIFVQYVIWLRDVMQGNLGFSWVSKRPVLELLLLKLPATLQLTLASLLIALIIAIPLGIISGARPHSWIDNLCSTLALAGVAMPAFWLGIMFILVIAVQFRWLPPSGYVEFTRDPWASLQRLILPATTLGLTLAAPLSRFMRSGMLEVMNADFIRVARAKGLNEWTVITRHAVRNALLTVVTVFGLQFGGLLGGTIIIEQVFSWPGIGLMVLTGINQRDYGVVQGVVLFVATGFVLVNLLVDVVYVYLDPRIRY